MHYNQVEYFLAIVTYGGFSRAADAIFISQSSLSKQIKALEEELGTELFNRRIPGNKLTESGEIFLRYAQKVIEQHIELMEALGGLSSKSIARIKLAALPIMSLAGYHFTSTIADFQSKYNQYDVDYLEKDQKSVLNMLNNGEVDFAIIRTDNPVLEDKYECLNLCMDEFVVACSKQHHLANKKLVSLSELNNENFILLEQKSMIYHICIDALHKAQLNPKVVYSNTRHNLILEMVSKNMGITLLPANIVDCYTQQLEIIKLNETFYSKVSLVRNKSSKHSKHCVAFWEFFKDAYRNCEKCQCK